MAEGFDPYHKWLGIPPKDQPPNHYRLLGIELFESDPEVIDMAASRLMSHLQELASGPDLKHSQKLLNEISAARRCLLKPEAKEAYDSQLRDSKPKSPPKKEPSAPQPPPVSGEAPPKSAGPAPPRPGTSSVDGFPGISIDDSPKTPREKKAPSRKKRKPGSASVELTDSGYLAELEKMASEPTEDAKPAKTIVPVEDNSPEIRVPTTSAAPLVKPDTAAPDTVGEGEPTSRSNRTAWLLVGGGAAAVLLLVLVFGLLTSDDAVSGTAGNSSAKGPTDSGKTTTLRPPRLVLNWVPEERANAKLMIDGEAKEVALEGVLAYELKEGEYHFRIEREGFEAIVGSGSVVAGVTRQVSPKWEPIAGPPKPKTVKPKTPPAKQAGTAKASEGAKPAGTAKPTTSKPAEPPTSATVKGKPGTQQKEGDNKPKSSVDFFADWPDALDLPSSRPENGTDSQAEKELAKLRGSRSKGAKLELLGGNVVLGDVGQFVLHRIKDGEPSRHVVKYAGKGGDETPVAAFTLRPNESQSRYSLVFAWNKDIRVSYVDRLRNCLLKITVADEERVTPLRKTLKSDPISLASPGGGNLSKRPVNAAPESSLLRLQITELTGTKPYQRKYKDVAIAMGRNQVIALQDGERPIHSRIQVELKSDRVEIESRILYRNAATSKQETFTPRVCIRPLGILRQQKQQLEFEKTRLGDPGRDEGKRQVLRQLTTASNQVSAEIRYLETLVRLCEQQHGEVLVHFRLYATIEGRQVCLARSD